MQIRKCDKCGKEVHIDPMQQAILPVYSILACYGINDCREIDLCLKCRQDFTKWLKTKGGEE